MGVRVEIFSAEEERDNELMNHDCEVFFDAIISGSAGSSQKIVDRPIRTRMQTEKIWRGLFLYVALFFFIHFFSKTSCQPARS